MNTYKKTAKIIKALANERRLRILSFLKSHKSRSVTAISGHIRLSLRSTSKHIGVLYAAGILEKQQTSTNVFCKIPSDIPPIARRIIDLL
jgi:DNA-binding transcriptional ArsR family regulator